MNQRQDTTRATSTVYAFQPIASVALILAGEEAAQLSVNHYLTHRKQSQSVTNAHNCHRRPIDQWVFIMPMSKPLQEASSDHQTARNTNLASNGQTRSSERYEVGHKAVTQRHSRTNEPWTFLCVVIRINEGWHCAAVQHYTHFQRSFVHSGFLTRADEARTNSESASRLPITYWSVRKHIPYNATSYIPVPRDPACLSALRARKLRIVPRRPRP